jgi:hypothetical protein
MPRKNSNSTLPIISRRPSGRPRRGVDSAWASPWWRHYTFGRVWRCTAFTLQLRYFILTYSATIALQRMEDQGGFATERSSGDTELTQNKRISKRGNPFSLYIYSVSPLFRALGLTIYTIQTTFVYDRYSHRLIWQYL